MVSFSCEGCGDVLTKKKLDPHRNQCRGATFTCLDCMVHFWGTEYRSHTSCISEAQKYQGALYRPEKEKKGKQGPTKAVIPKKASVEDVPEEESTALTLMSPRLPDAPSPPPAAPEFAQKINVFDFMDPSETPNPSTTQLAIAERPASPATHPTVRFEDDSALVQYGSGPVEIATSPYRTPAPKSERKKKDRGDKESKSTKRKRLHVDTAIHDGDSPMPDAPAVLHSGLTGGLNRLLSRQGMFPPSPEYSGDAGESPGSPLKRTKHRGRGAAFSDTIMGLITGREVEKEREKAERRRRRKRAEAEGETNGEVKMIEYTPQRNDDSGGGEMVLYTEQEDLAERFLSLVNKGPESERGCSVNKALKRWHRERAAEQGGRELGFRKGEEEKELWRSLRMRRNERGEVVLFF